MSRSSQSKFTIFQQASLSQKIADKIPILQKLSGADKQLSDNIAILTFLKEKDLIEEESAGFLLELLDVLRLSSFATSEKTNEISKLGFMLPKGAPEVDFSDERK